MTLQPVLEPLTAAGLTAMVREDGRLTVYPEERITRASTDISAPTTTRSSRPSPHCQTASSTPGARGAVDMRSCWHLPTLMSSAPAARRSGNHNDATTRAPSTRRRDASRARTRERGGGVTAKDFLKSRTPVGPSKKRICGKKTPPNRDRSRNAWRVQNGPNPPLR
jgi:hypothetical protein